MEMEMEIEKIFSDIKISGEFYGSELEKVQKIIEPARKILDIMEENFGDLHCEIVIRDNKVRIVAFDSARPLNTIFQLEIGKDSFKFYHENEISEEIVHELVPHFLEIYRNI